MIDWSIRLPDQVVVTGTSSGLGQETARLLLDAGVRVYGVDVAEAAVDLGKSDAFTEVRGSVIEVATWHEVIAALHADAPAGVASLGFVGAAAVLDVGILDDEDMAVWRRAWEYQRARQRRRAAGTPPTADGGRPRRRGRGQQRERTVR